MIEDGPILIGIKYACKNYHMGIPTRAMFGKA